MTGKLTESEADQIVDVAINAIMKRDGVSYARAFFALINEKPGMLAGYESVKRRGIMERSQSNGVRLK